jgi:hypothetical protein
MSDGLAIVLFPTLCGVRVELVETGPERDFQTQTLLWFCDAASTQDNDPSSPSAARADKIVWEMRYGWRVPARNCREAYSLATLMQWTSKPSPREFTRLSTYRSTSLD